MSANQRLFIVLLVPCLGSLPSRAVDSPTGRAPRIDIGLSQANLKRMGLAFHKFNAANLSLPIDLATSDGKPLLSWRVVILPYLGEEALYKQFKLDEPWDSPHNRTLIPKMPRVYAPFRVKAREGETFYQVCTGQDTIFAPGRLSRIPHSMPDGTSNTGLVYEAAEPVIWTKPGGIPFDDNKPLPKFGGMFEGSWNVLMCDGSVYRVRKDADDEQVRRVIMPNDGYVISGDIFIE